MLDDPVGDWDYENDDEAPPAWRGRAILAAVSVAVFGGLYWISQYSYLLFHSLVEFFSICISAVIFVMAWNLRVFLGNKYLYLIGVGYLFVGGLDLLHLLSFKGMGIELFHPYDANLAAQLWITSRFIEAGVLFVAMTWPHKRWSDGSLFGAMLVISGGSLALMLLGWYPDAYVDGLTVFKQMSEFAVIGVLLLALYMLTRQREYIYSEMRRLLSWAIAASIAAELCFTAYIGVYDFANFLGHSFKIVSFWMIYKAVVELGLAQPQALLFRRVAEVEDE